MKTRRVLRDIGLLSVLFVCYIAAVCHHMSRFAPAANAHTFADLQHQGLPMKRALSVPSLPGHVCVLGETTLWTLPSGPPAYHFDERGRLIDFTLDVGDSTRFQKNYDIYRGKEIKVADLPARFRETSP